MIVPTPHPPTPQVKKEEECEKEEIEERGGGGVACYPFPPIKGKRDCHG